MTIVDIIIPVYNAVDDLTACVASVRRHTRRGSYCLVAIDDASPDPRIAAFLSTLASEGPEQLVVLRNERNLGFVGTANRGMALHADRDVVLLNSDTLVTPNWLDLIRRCADSDPAIGTITPFSNNAEICSFPIFCRDNPLEELPPVERIADAFARRMPTYPDIPTAVGFCMYIRRSLLDRIGDFDVATFGLGYGEENDFSMRGAQAGYRNVLCDNAFVAHTGGRSFDDRKLALMKENGQRLLERYPRYDDLVHEFIRADPLREIRQQAQDALMREADTPVTPPGSILNRLRNWFA